MHVIGPEQGLTVPGVTLVCGDSHTATHGAFGALACTLFEHRFEVWVRPGESQAKHPHLGAWSRCARCGLERDWLLPSERPEPGDPVIDRVHGALLKALADPGVRSNLSGQGADPVGNTPEQYDAFNKAEIAKWIKVARGAGIDPE